MGIIDLPSCDIVIDEVIFIQIDLSMTIYGYKIAKM